MKVLACLFVVLAVANAGLLLNNGLYGSGVYSSGNIISAPATYVQSAPVLQSSVHIVRSPISSAVYASAPVYHSASVYRSAPIISAPLAHAAVVAPIAHAPIVAAPVLSHGLAYGGYGINGILKRQ